MNEPTGSLTSESVSTGNAVRTCSKRYSVTPILLSVLVRASSPRATVLAKVAKNLKANVVSGESVEGTNMKRVAERVL